MKALIMSFTILAFLFSSTQLFAQTTRPSEPQNRPQLDLNGKWKTDQDEEVIIKQQDNSVTATFVSGGDCQWGGARSYYIQGNLQGKTLRGSLLLCTRNKQLLDDCHLTDPYTAKFEATASAKSITGTYRPDYINYDEKDGHYVNCSITPGGGGVTTFTLTRVCDPCQGITSATQTLLAVKQSPGSASLYQNLQQTMGWELDQIGNQLCDDSNAQSQLDDVRKELDALNYVPGKSNTPNNLRLLHIEDGLTQLNESLCAAAAPSSGSGACASGEKKVEPGGDEEVVKFVKDMFKEALDKLEKTAREMQDRGDPVTQTIKDNTKILQKVIEIQKQIKAGSCVPIDVLQWMQTVMIDHRSARNSDNCGPMCSALKKWYESLIGQGSSFQGNRFYLECVAICN